jgi:hypothetical protein
MGEIVIISVIAVGIFAVAALVFGGWFVVTVVRGIAGFLGIVPTPPEPGRAFGPRRRARGMIDAPAQGVAGAGQRLCPYELCKSTNDLHARYCRRCGREMGPANPVRVRRAAVW